MLDFDVAELDNNDLLQVVEDIIIAYKGNIQNINEEKL